MLSKERAGHFSTGTACTPRRLCQPVHARQLLIHTLLPVETVDNSGNTLIVPLFSEDLQTFAKLPHAFPRTSKVLTMQSAAVCCIVVLAKGARCSVRAC